MRFVDEYRAPEQVMQLIEHLREREMCIRDRVQAVGFTRTGKDLCHFHGGFTHAEELHKAGVEAGKVTGEAEVEPVSYTHLDAQWNENSR